MPISAEKHKSTYSPSEKNQSYNQTPIRPENEDSAVVEQGISDEAGAKQPLQAEASFEKNIEPTQTLYMEELVPPEPSVRSDKIVSEGGTSDPNPFLERAVSTIDSTLIDPALRRQPNPEDVILKRSTTQSKESIRSTGLINAAVITARVMSAPVETDYTDVDTSLEIVLSKDGSGSTDNKVLLSEEATILDKANSEEVAREPTKSEQSKTSLEATTVPSSTVHTTISGPSITPKSPKGESKVSSWLKTKFYRRPSKPVKTEINDPIKKSSSDFIAAAPSFVPIRSDDEEPHNESAESRTHIESREVSDNAQERLSETNIDTRPQLGRQEHLSISSSIGSVSSSEGTRGRPELRREQTSSSHGDNFEEAQDSFESGKLAPPMVLRDKAHGSDSPVRDSRFQENL